MSCQRPVRTALVLPLAAACVLGLCASGSRAQRPASSQDEATSATPGRMPVERTTLAAPATQPTSSQPTSSQHGPSQPPTTRPSTVRQGINDRNGDGSTTPAVGQPTDAPPRVVGPPAIEEVRPEVYYLKNDKGELEPILGFTYEDFYRLYRLEQKLQQGARPPAFRFEQATFSGKVENGRAELRAELQIAASQAGWIRVPLGLASAILADAPGGSGARTAADEAKDDNAPKNASERMLLFEPGDGYVLWLNGEEGQTHSVVLERLLAPVETDGGESRLRLSLPRGLAAADVRLSVPVADAQVRTSDAATIVSTKPSDGSTDDRGTTEIAVTARGGDLQISWRAGVKDVASVARVVESTAAIRVTVDDRSILWDAQLTVRSMRGPLESFDVRLPLGAELEPAAPAGFVVSVSGGSPQVATFSLRKATTEPVTVRLVCRRVREASNGQEEIDFSGFALVDAARQSGVLVVAIDGDWRIAWRQRTDVREAEQPPESLAPPEDQQAFAFDFYRQPFSLSGAVSPQPTRLDVEPQYQVAVEADRLVLTGRLIYKVRGAKVSRVQVRLAGWELDEVGPPGVVHAAGAVTGDDGLLTVPLAQRMRSTFELTLLAGRPLPLDAKRIDFVLPVAAADAAAPPVLVVDVADNIDLMPVEAETTHLAPRGGPPPSGMKTAARRHPPLVYRVLDDGQAARFVADRKIRSREVSADSTTEVRIDAGEAVVEQNLDLRVAYEALNRVVLELPAALAGRRDVSYAIDGQAVLPIELAAAEANGAAASGKDWFATASGGQRVALEPPTAIVDRARITVRHSIRPAAEDAGETWKVPLVSAHEAVMWDNVVRASAKTATQFTADAPWTAARTSDINDATSAFRAAGRAEEIVLRAASKPRRTTIQTTWIRTTTAGGLRQDRVAFRVQSDERRLEIALPVGARADRVAAWVDGRVVEPSLAAAVRADGERLRVGIDVPAAGARRTAGASEPPTHTVEVLYDVEGDSAGLGVHTWEAPRVLGDVWQARTWWEIIVPQDEHLAVDPSGLTPEYAWQWDAAVRWGEAPILPVLGRRPNLTAAELQRLTGASPLRIAGRANRYLYSASGPVERIEFHTLPRWLIVLVASGTAIAVGLLFIYVPIVRRPAVLLLGGVVLAATAVWSPSAAILAGQAGAAGMLLAVAAGVAAWTLGGRRAVAAAPSTRTDRIERGSSANRPRRGEPSQATTLTVPAEMDVADINR